MNASVITCPKCGASLSVENYARMVTCSYCNSSVVVESGQTTPGGAEPARGGGFARVGVAMGALMFLGVAALVVLTRGQGGAPTPPSGSTTVPTSETASAPQPTATPLAVPTASAQPTASAPSTADTPALADVVLDFGEKGTGPGKFEDARAITVDPSGDIYVAEYGSLRIQRFDSSGKYVDSLGIEAGKQGSAIPSIAATSDGHLWVSRSGDLLELALPEGKVVKTLENQTPHVAYGAVTVDAANTVYAENLGATTFVSVDGRGPPRSDDVRKLDKNGRLLAAWKDISSSSFGDHIAVDGEGSVYLAERFRRIDVIDKKGNVKARINAAGEGGIAIDAKGRIFLGGSGHGIAVFEATGAKLGEIAMQGVDDIAIGHDGRLYTIASRNRVRVLTLR
jgi:hypothetical protein